MSCTSLKKKEITHFFAHTDFQKSKLQCNLNFVLGKT